MTNALSNYLDVFSCINSSRSVSWLRSPCYSKQLHISHGYERVWNHTCRDLIKNPNSWFDHLISEMKDDPDLVLKNKSLLSPHVNYYHILGKNDSILKICDLVFPIFENNKIVAVGGIASPVENEKLSAIQPTLSKRERQCLNMTLDGMTAPGIALKLNLSKRTVEGYLSNLKNKTGCANKIELIAYAFNKRHR